MRTALGTRKHRCRARRYLQSALSHRRRAHDHQPHPLYRVYLDHRWVYLQPGERKQILVMVESLLGDPGSTRSCVTSSTAIVEV